MAATIVEKELALPRLGGLLSLPFVGAGADAPDDSLERHPIQDWPAPESSTAAELRRVSHHVHWTLSALAALVPGDDAQPVSDQGELMRKSGLQIGVVRRSAFSQYLENAVGQGRVGQEAGETLRVKVPQLNVGPPDAGEGLSGGVAKVMRDGAKVSRTDKDEQASLGGFLARLLDVVGHPGLAHFLLVRARSRLSLIDQ